MLFLGSEGAGLPVWEHTNDHCWFVTNYPGSEYPSAIQECRVLSGLYDCLI